MTHYFVHLDINSIGEDIKEDRTSGANAYHRQSYKTLNADCQKRKRVDKRRMELWKKYNEAVVEHNIILNILEHNKAVDSGL